MFGLVFLILFTPGVSEFLCTSSDLELSYTFCGQNPSLQITLPTILFAGGAGAGTPAFHLWAHHSMAHDFMFNLTPCSIMNKPIWSLALTWIPRSDITFLKVIFKVWYNGAKALHWKEVLCSGVDDEYSVCGRLKGETVATAFDIKGARISFPKGNYDIVLQGFSDDSENNMIACLNLTMIVKQDPF